MNFVTYFVIFTHSAPLNTHNLTLYQLKYHLVKLDFGWFVNEDEIISAEMVKYDFFFLFIFSCVCIYQWSVLLFSTTEIGVCAAYD